MAESDDAAEVSAGDGYAVVKSCDCGACVVVSADEYAYVSWYCAVEEVSVSVADACVCYLGACSACVNCVYGAFDGT